MKPTESAVRDSKSRDSSIEPHERTTSPPFVACIKNYGCEDLQLLKLYPLLPDEAAAEEGLLRIVDDSGEDYLYPAENFILVPLPAWVEQALAAVPTVGSGFRS